MVKIQASRRLRASNEVALGITYLKWLGFEVVDRDPHKGFVDKGVLTYEVRVEDVDATVDEVTKHLKVKPSRTESKGFMPTTEWVWRLSSTQWVSLRTFVMPTSKKKVWQALIVDTGYGTLRNDSNSMHSPPRGPSRLKWR